jgi:tRNA-Thr(GGU) m(6)t(6)A37 methyltransferase TsaA
MEIKIKPIGIINSLYKTKADSPRQGRFSDEKSTLEIFDEFEKGLLGLEIHKYFIILYWQHKAERYKLEVVPHDKTEKRGIFSTRAPVRPNPIGFCLVKLLKIDGNILTVKWLDALDGSPLIDIKPFYKFDIP